MFAKPTFIAFTGVDTADTIADMKSLAAHWPIEWGVLVDDDKTDDALFANLEIRRKLLTSSGLKFAAHVCGEQASKIANQPNAATVDLSGFRRIQVNHGFSGSSPDQIENVVRFGRSRGLRSMLQTLTEFPSDSRLDWLYDTSFGTGKTPDRWPSLPSEKGPFCGYSGGINSDNVASVISAIAAPDGAQYFIDMELGVRTDGRFDLAKCEAVCRAVFG